MKTCRKKKRVVGTVSALYDAQNGGEDKKRRWEGNVTVARGAEYLAYLLNYVGYCTLR